MKKKIILSKTLSIGMNTLLVTSALTLVACSSVRDATDWVPGVDSNKEIQSEKDRQALENKAKEREAYEDKAAFAPTTIMAGSASETDAKINVTISQKYTSENVINREDIGIEVNAGVVTLTGSVNSDESAVKAIAIAKNTANVSKVISKLVVIKLRTQ